MTDPIKRSKDGLIQGIDWDAIADLVERLDKVDYNLDGGTPYSTYGGIAPIIGGEP